MSDVQRPDKPAPLSAIGLGAGLVFGSIAVMWFTEFLDTILLDDRLQGNGIKPRELSGVLGILWAPFLHGGFLHLLSNTVPFAMLSLLVMARGVERWVTGSAIIIGLGGLLLWLFAFGDNEVHIGASGWIFGLFGLLLSAAYFERKPTSILLAFVALVLYGTTLLFGFIPRPGISWEGHLFGAVAGVAAGWFLAPKPNEAAEGDPRLS